MTNHQTQPRGRAGLGHALGKGFRAAYDNLGYVVLATFPAFVITSGLIAAAMAVVRATRPGMSGIAWFVPAVLAAWLCAAGVFYYASRSVYHEYPAIGETWTGIKTLAWPAVKLFVIDLIVAAVLVGDTLFFLAAKGGPIFPILGAACGYLALVWMMMAMYHLPLLVAQLEMESGPGAFVVVRKSFLLTLDNPGFTVGLFVVIIALAAVCAVPAFIGTAVFYLGASAFILTHALREIFVKYGIVREEPEVVEDTGWPRRE